MKLQFLAILFVILILPISIIIGEYASFQIETFRLERLYDSRLITATHDALKTFQINTFNDMTSDIADSKTNIIEASANTFYNSMESAFGMQGYSKEDLKTYVPALVYTMYDGYYIYSPYTNIAQIVESGNSEGGEEGGSSSGSEENAEGKTLVEGNLYLDISENNKNIEYGFKPYVYYSCRYFINNNNDFIINYSLDNYITVQGIVNGKSTYKSGYLVTLADSKTDEGLIRIYNNENGMYEYYYSGQKIVPEVLKESILEKIKDPTTGEIEITTKEYEYIQVNGTKYYIGTDEDIDGDGKKDEYIFYLKGGNRTEQKAKKKEIVAYNQYVSNIKLNRSAISYYKNAFEFTNWVNDNLGGLQLKHAEGITTSENENDFIFENKQIEYSASNFNIHRKEVIRHSIESNLSVAIANFNSYANTEVNFQMPKLKENEWEMLENEVSIISFLQGINLGGKIYNGYTVVANSKNGEVVSDDSIYITTTEGYYYKVNDKKFADTNFDENTVLEGVLNLDFETRKDSITGKNYVHKAGFGSYSSIVGRENVNNKFDSIYEYLQETSTIDSKIKQIYYEALARERWGMFKIANPSENATILESMSCAQDYKPITENEKNINGKGIVTDNLIRYYDGKNIDGYGNAGNNSKVTEWTDLSGHCNGIMMDGTYQIDSQTNEVIKTTAGIQTSSDGYVDFDGVDYSESEEEWYKTGDWVNVGEIKNLKILTLETVFEMKPFKDGDNANHYLISNANGGGISLYVSKNRKVYFDIILEDKVTIKRVESNETIVPGKKYHVFAIYDGLTMMLYLKNKTDGVTDIQTLNVDVKIPEPTDNTVMALGVNPDGNDGTKTNWGWANIKMYTTRIYDSALTVDMIEQNIESTKFTNSGETEPEVYIAPNIEISNLTYSPEWFSSNPNNIVKPVLKADLKVTDGGTGIKSVAYAFAKTEDKSDTSLVWRYVTCEGNEINENISLDEGVTSGGTWYLHVKATSGTGIGKAESYETATYNVVEDSSGPSIKITNMADSNETTEYIILTGNENVIIEKIATVSQDNIISGINRNSVEVTITNPNGEMLKHTGLSVTNLSTIPILIDANQEGDWILTVTVKDNAGNTGIASSIYSVKKASAYTVKITDYDSETDTTLYTGRTVFDINKKISIESSEGLINPIVKYAWIPDGSTPAESDYQIYSSNGINQQVNLNLNTQLYYKLWIRVYEGTELKQETSKQYKFYKQTIDSM